jgi:hypothetical protein
MLCFNLFTSIETTNHSTYSSNWTFYNHCSILLRKDLCDMNSCIESTYKDSYKFYSNSFVLAPVDQTSEKIVINFIVLFISAIQRQYRTVNTDHCLYNPSRPQSHIHYPRYKFFRIFLELQSYFSREISPWNFCMHSPSLNSIKFLTLFVITNSKLSCFRFTMKGSRESSARTLTC